MSTARASGTSDAPSILSYPQPIKESEYNGLKDQYCYIIRHYGYSGVALLIHHRNGINLRVGDWSGKVVDLADKSNPIYEPATHILRVHGPKLVQLTTLVRLPQCILYFSLQDEKPILVDVRISLNKFVTPGMLNDVFGKVVQTQHIIGTQVLNDTIYNSILSGIGEYSSDIILKPNRYRHTMVGQTPVPLYVEITR